MKTRFRLCATVLPDSASPKTFLFGSPNELRCSEALEPEPTDPLDQSPEIHLQLVAKRGLREKDAGGSSYT